MLIYLHWICTPTSSNFISYCNMPTFGMDRYRWVSTSKARVVAMTSIMLRYGCDAITNHSKCLMFIWSSRRKPIKVRVLSFSSERRCNWIFLGSISSQHHSHSVKYAVQCQQITFINHTDETDSTPYPSNLLRNIARAGMTLTNVKYVLSLDVDVFPSSDLFHHLVTFYMQSPTEEVFNRTLYVIPTFEIHNEAIQRSLPVPQNKRELILLWSDKQVRPFETDICPSCQSATNYQAWREETKNDKIVPLFRPHYSQPWKPFYIGPREVPMFDPRFKAHAHARISQVKRSIILRGSCILFSL